MSGAFFWGAMPYKDPEKNKEYMKNYRREYRKRPRSKELKRRQYRRSYAENPEFRERVREKSRKHGREYRKRPDVKARRKEYLEEYNQRPEAQELKRKRELERYYRMGGHGYRRHWRFLLERDGPQCQICGEHLNPHAEPFHVDHVKPVAKGGTSDPSNLQLAHPDCNVQKGTS